MKHKIQVTLFIGIFLFFCIFYLPLSVADKSDFKDLGVPVPLAALMSATIGSDATGQKDMIYLSCAQTASNLLLLSVDPESGVTQTYESNTAPGAWAIARGADDNIYLGTWNNAHLLRFQPRHPELGMQDLGCPVPGETYIWMLTTAPDGKLYGCTYPHAKLFSYDPATTITRNFGSMDDTQKYARSLASGKNGKIYVGIGFGKANVVVFDPTSETHKSILPAKYQRETVASIYQTDDRTVYAKCGSQWFRIVDEEMIPIPDIQLQHLRQLTLRDGRKVNTGNLPTTAQSLTITNPHTQKATPIVLNYESKGASIFVVAPGLNGKIYGSSYIPLQLFEHNSLTTANKALGKPVPMDGQLYSLLAYKDRLYMCAYATDGYISVYKPDSPFRFGTDATANPRGLGVIGEGHLRPRTMILGPDDKFFIGSLPPYGKWGGAMAVFDPEQDKVIANYLSIIPDQGIMSLAYEPNSRLIFGGTNIAGGGGTDPKAKDARLFAWNHIQKSKALDIVPVMGDSAIVAMTTAHGKVFAVGAPSNTLSVYDTQSQRIIHQKKIEFGSVREISLGLHTNGKIYGLAGKSIFTIDPVTFVQQHEATFPGDITAGFALTEDFLYFGSKTHLIRYTLR